MSDPQGPFKVILSSVDETWNSRLRSEVSRLFQIDDETASNIVSAIPIVVLDGLDARAAGIVRERMRGLVEAGCRVVTTDDPADTIPRVNWPEMPDIARIPPEEPQKVITVQADTSKAPPLASFSCPGCGLLFHVSGASRAQATAGTKDKVGAPASPGAGAPSGGVPGTGGTNGKEPHAPVKAAPAHASVEPGARLAGDEWLDPPIQTKKTPEQKTFEQKIEKEAPITRAPAPVAKAPEPAPVAKAPEPASVAAAKKAPSLLDDPLLAAKRYDAPAATASASEPSVLSTSEPTTLVARPITNRFSRSVVPQGSATTAAPPPTARPSAPVPAPSPTTGRFAAPPPPPSQSGRFAPPPPAATPSASTPRTAAVPPTKNFGPPPKPAMDSTHSDAKKTDDDELDVRFDADESADMKALQKNAKKPAPVDDDDEPNLLLDSEDKEPEPAPVSKKAPAKKEEPKKGRSFDEDDDDLLPFDELDSQGVDVEAPNAKAASASSSDGSFDGGRIDDLLDAPPQATVSKGKKPDPRFEDDDELLLDDEEPAPKPAKGAPAKKTAVREEEKEETLFGDSGDDKPALSEGRGPQGRDRVEGPALKPDKGKAAAGKGSKIPRESGFADALDMFDDDDERPLGSGAGDDADIPEIKPLDLASDVQGIPAPAVARGGGKKKPESPFDKPSSSAILEPLDPNEAMAILKTHQKEDAETQDRPAARKPVDPLEPLDPNEALAILGTPDERGKGGKGTPPRKPPRQKNGRTSDASKLVPLSASDEDFAFLEQGKTGGKGGAKATDPFARAKKAPSNDKLTILPKKRGEDEEDEEEEAPRPAPRPSAPAKGGSPGASSKSPKRGAPVPEGQGECGLVLPRIATDSKRQKAAELISEIKGMGVDEALKLTERTIIPVLTGVSRDVAEFHREKFERNKISARVTTRQKEK